MTDMSERTGRWICVLVGACLLLGILIQIAKEMW